ncbi:MAG: EamA family transporter [Bermanella sp.]
MKTVLWTLLTAMAPILWGSTYIVTTEILPDGMPFTAAVIRCLPAGLILIAISRYRPSGAQWKQLLMLSFFNFACFQGLLFIAAYRLPGGLAAVIGAIQPLVVLALGWIVLTDKPAKLTFFACLTAIVGMAMLIISPMMNQGVLWDEVGIIAAFFGAISMGVGIFYSKHWQQKSSANTPLLAFTGWQLTLGGIMLLPFSLWLDPSLPALTLEHALGFSYLAIIGTLLTYLIWFTGVSKLSSAAVSALGLLSPISAIILGWLILNQTIEGWALVGLSIVIASVLIVQYSQSRKPKIHNINILQMSQTEKTA